MTAQRPALPILHTKLYRPATTPDLVVRERLLARLGSDRLPPLTLVSAPAGYGKTTLISHWLETLDRPSAWLSLDESDGEPRVFLGYLVAALRGLFPGCCRELSALLDSDELPPAAYLAARLSNELEAIAEPFVLALDDYHRIREPTVHELLDRLLAHPPRRLHLAILTRRNPPLSLAALRARHQVREIRMRDLRFDRRETAEFLERTLERPVGGSAVPRLHKTTEGWPVALRLVALALRDRDAGELARGFDGDSRELQEYLLAEILERQPEAVRECLGKTSILERFCLPLCAAVCGWTSEEGGDAASGAAFVDLLESRGLPVVALDERCRWFRYHHLFQELLRRRLDAELDAGEIAALHRRAARWLEGEGLIEDALHHVLEAGDAAAAGRLVKRHRQEILDREQWHRLDRWLARLPAEVVAADAELLLTRAWSMGNRFRHGELGLVLGRVETLLGGVAEATGRRRLQGELDVQHAHRDYFAARGRRAVAHAERALRRLPPESVTQRAAATIYLAGGLQMTGEWRRAAELIRRRLGRSAGEAATHGRMLLTLGFLQWIEADLTAFEQTGATMLEVGRSQGLPETSAFARYFQGAARYQRGDLDAAERWVAAVVSDPARPIVGNWLRCVAVLAFCHQARGRPAEARELVESAARHFLAVGNTFALAHVQACQAELALRQGRLAEAVRWASAFEAGELVPAFGFFVPGLIAARIFLAQGSPEALERARHLLADMRTFLEHTHNTRFLIDALALQALLYDAEGDESAALAALERAVVLAQPGRFLRLFVDLGPGLCALLLRLDLEGDAGRYVSEIVDAFGHEARGPQPAAAQPQLIEPLTRRELEILRLLADRLSNKEIAAELFISPVTVKRHAHNLYQKLGVHGRRAAVTRAAEIGLLA